MNAIAQKFTMASVVLVGLLTLVGSGGPRYVVRPAQNEATATNKYFKAYAMPKCNAGCKSFVLSIENKTENDLEIDWNKTLFFAQGSTQGGFMFEGVVYGQRNAPKSPDIVFARSNFAKEIFPNILVDYSSGKYGGWQHNDMPIGEIGVYLTVRAGSEEIRERLKVNLDMVQVR